MKPGENKIQSLINKLPPDENSTILFNDQSLLHKDHIEEMLTLNFKLINTLGGEGNRFLLVMNLDIGISKR